MMFAIWLVVTAIVFWFLVEHYYWKGFRDGWDDYEAGCTCNCHKEINR